MCCRGFLLVGACNTYRRFAILARGYPPAKRCCVAGSAARNLRTTRHDSSYDRRRCHRPRLWGAKLRRLFQIAAPTRRAAPSASDLGGRRRRRASRAEPHGSPSASAPRPERCCRRGVGLIAETPHRLAWIAESASSHFSFQSPNAAAQSPMRRMVPTGMRVAFVLVPRRELAHGACRPGRSPCLLPRTGAPGGGIRGFWSEGSSPRAFLKPLNQ